MIRVVVVAAILTSLTSLASPAGAAEPERAAPADPRSSSWATSSHNPNAVIHATRVDDMPSTIGTMATGLPFTYVVDFSVKLEGRLMYTQTNQFCNYFRSTSAPGTSQIYIQLRGNGAGFANVSFPTNGQTYVYCWTGFANGVSYYFRYTKANDGRYVQGNGSVNG